MKIYLHKPLNSTKLITFFDELKENERQQILENPDKKADINLQIVLEDNTTFDEIAPDFTVALTHMLRHADIKKLSITDAKLTAANLQEIKAEIINEKTLEALSFSKNNLGDDGMRVVAEILNSNTSIVHCELAENHISDDGARILIYGLRNNNNVAVLDLSKNEITDGNIFLRNHHVKFLYVDSNQIDKLDESRPNITDTKWLDFSENVMLRSYTLPYQISDYCADWEIYLDLKKTARSKYILTQDNTADFHDQIVGQDAQYFDTNTL